MNARMQHPPGGYLFGAITLIYWGVIWYLYTMGVDITFPGAVILYLTIAVILVIVYATFAFRPVVETILRHEKIPERPPYDHTVLGIAEFVIFLSSLFILWLLVDWIALPPQTRAIILMAVGVVYAVIYIPARRTRSNNIIEALNILTIPLGTAIFLIVILSIFNGDFGDIGGAVPVINNFIEEITTALQIK